MKFQLAILICLLVYTIAVTEKATEGPTPDSVKEFIPADFTTKLRSATDTHGECYACGVLSGITKSQCDKAFLEQMSQTCKTILPGNKVGLESKCQIIIQGHYKEATQHRIYSETGDSRCSQPADETQPHSERDEL